MFANLGSAVGNIVIRTDDLTRAQGVVLTSAQAMTRGFAGLNDELDETSAASAAAEAGMVAIGAAGLAAAQKVKVIESTFRILAGGQQQANVYMAQLQKLADDTKQPFLSLVDAATRLLPQVRQTNVELDKTVAISQRLMLLAPEQGPQGASFALREFLAGQYTSIARRFNINRDAVRAALEEANGDMNAALDNLSKLLERAGATEDAVKELGNEGVYAFSTMKDSIIQLMSSAFTPLLNQLVIPATNAFTNMAKGMKDGEVGAYALAAGIAAVVFAAKNLAGIGPIKLAIGAAAVDTGANIGKSIVQAIGKIPGNQVDPKLKEGSGYDFWEVIKERLGQVVVILAPKIIEMIGQLQNFVKSIGNTVDGLVASFTIAGLQVEVFASKLQVIGAQIAQWFADNVTHDEEASKAAQQQQKDLLTKIYGPAQAERMMAGANDPDGNYFLKHGPFGDTFVANNKTIDNLNQQHDANALTNNFGLAGNMMNPPVVAATNDNTGATKDQTKSTEDNTAAQVSLMDQIKTLNDKLSSGTNGATPGQQGSTQNWVDQAKQDVVKWLVGMGFGAPAKKQETVADDAGSGKSTAMSVSEMVQQVATAFAEARAKIIKLRDDFKSDQDRQLADQQRSDQQNLEDFQLQRKRANEDLQRSLDRFDENASDQVKEAEDNIDKIKSDYADKQQQREKENNDQAEKDEEAHQKRLRDIIKGASADIEDAIAARDASAAQSAIRRREQDLDKENESFDETKKSREDQLQVQKDADEKEYQERLASAQKDLQTLKDNNAERRQEMLDDFALQQQREDEDRAIANKRKDEQRAIDEARAKEDLEKKAKDIFDEAALNNEAWAQFKDLLGDSRQAVIDWAMGLRDDLTDIISQATTASTSLLDSASAAIVAALTGFSGSSSSNQRMAAGSASTPYTSSTGGVGAPLGMPQTAVPAAPAKGSTSYSDAIASYAATQAARLAANAARFSQRFANGGIPPLFQRVLVGEHGPEWAVFNQPAHIYPSGTTPSHGVSDLSQGIHIDMSGMQIHATSETAEKIVQQVRDTVVPELAAQLYIAKKRQSSL